MYAVPPTADRPKILPAEISLVVRDFVDSEVLSCGSNERGQVRGVSRVRCGHFHRSHNIRGDSAHHMAFNPLGLFYHFLPFGIEPTVINRGRESGGIYGEICFYRAKWQSTLFNKSFQQWGQVGILQIAGGPLMSYIFTHSIISYNHNRTAIFN